MQNQWPSIVPVLENERLATERYMGLDVQPDFADISQSLSIEDGGIGFSLCSRSGVQRICVLLACQFVLQAYGESISCAMGTSGIHFLQRYRCASTLPL